MCSFAQFTMLMAFVLRRAITARLPQAMPLCVLLIVPSVALCGVQESEDEQTGECEVLNEDEHLPLLIAIDELAGNEDLAPSCIDRLQSLTKSPDSSVACSAYMTLLHIEKNYEDADLHLLVECLEAKNGAVREQCCDVFALVGVAGVPILTEALSSPSATTRAWAAKSLGLIGNPAIAAVPTLTRAAATDSVAGVRGSAIRALAAMEVSTPEVIGTIQSARTDSSEYVREAADSALRVLPSGRSPAIGTLNNHTFLISVLLCLFAALIGVVFWWRARRIEAERR